MKIADYIVKFYNGFRKITSDLKSHPAYQGIEPIPLKAPEFPPYPDQPVYDGRKIDSSDDEKAAYSPEESSVNTYYVRPNQESRRERVMPDEPDEEDMDEDDTPEDDTGDTHDDDDTAGADTTPDLDGILDSDDTESGYGSIDDLVDDFVEDLVDDIDDTDDVEDIEEPPDEEPDPEEFPEDELMEDPDEPMNPFGMGGW